MGMKFDSGIITNLGEGQIMTNFDIIGACVTLFLLGVFIYVAKRGAV
jgi:hypothetical protein